MSYPAGETGVRSSTEVLRRNTSLEQRDALLLDMVRWCVERYFGYKPAGTAEPKVTSPAGGTASQKPRSKE